MKFIYNILFLSLGCTVLAQPNDTIFIKKNENEALIKGFLWQNPIQATQLVLKNYTQTGVRYSIDNQNIKRVQTADKKNDFEFFTEGFYQYHPKLKLFGDFKINQFNEKGLAYNLTNERTSNQNKILSPNYYYSPSKGDWKNQLYQLTAGGSYEFLNNTFFGLAFNYKNALNNRTSDPRPSNIENQFNTKLSIGYQLKQHTLVLNYQNISSKLENETYYENRASVNPSTDPEFYIKFSSGYGYKVFVGDFSRYLNKTKAHYFGASYTLNLPKTFVSAGFDFGTSQTNHFPTNGTSGNSSRPLEFDFLARYKAKTTSTKTTVYLNKTFNVNNLEVKTTFETRTLMNYITANQSTNYKLQGQAINIESIYNFANKTYLNAIGIDAFIDAFHVKDLLGITEKQHSSIDFTIFAQNRFKVKQNNSFFVNVGLGAYIPFKNDLNYTAATQDQDFADNVIKKDAVYDETQKINASFLTHYDLFHKNKTIRFSASYKLVNTLNSTIKNTNNSMKGNANYVTMGISVIY